MMKESTITGIRMLYFHCLTVFEKERKKEWNGDDEAPFIYMLWDQSSLERERERKRVEFFYVILKYSQFFSRRIGLFKKF